MLVLAIFYFIFVTYNCVKSLIHYCKTKKFEKAELVDDITDFSLSVFLLLIGLAAEEIIAYNWIIFGIPLLVHVAGKLYLRKLTGYSVNV